MTALAAAILIFVTALVLQALFAGYESSFVSAYPIRVRHLAAESGNPRAQKLLEHISNPGAMLTTLLIGTNLAVVTGALAVTWELERLALARGWEGLYRYHELAALLIVTPTFLIFAEIIPKSVFRVHPNRLSLALLPAIQVFYWVLAPVAYPVHWVTRGILRLTGRHPEDLVPLMASLEDVRVLIDESAEHGAIRREEQRMIHSVFDLSNLSVLGEEIEDVFPELPDPRFLSKVDDSE